MCVCAIFSLISFGISLKPPRALSRPSQISRAGLAKALTQGLHRSGAMRFIEPEVHTLPLSQRPRVPTQTQTQTQMSQIATQFMADVGMTSTSTQGDGGVVVNPSMTRFKLKLSPDETIEIMGQVLGYLVDVKGVAENGEPQMHVLGTETGYRVSLLDTRRQPLRGEIIIGWDDKYADVSKVIVERSKVSPSSSSSSSPSPSPFLLSLSIHRMWLRKRWFTNEKMVIIFGERTRLLLTPISTLELLSLNSLSLILFCPASPLLLRPSFLPFLASFLPGRPSRMEEILVGHRQTRSTSTTSFED